MPPLPFSGPARPLGTYDISLAAARLAIPPAAVRAVLRVETGGAGGFLSDGSGRPRILFEAAVFGRLTRHVHDEKHPSISAPRWDRSLYVGGAGEYDRLARACELDRHAAIMSASWGLFQVMGQNFGLCGFRTAEEFVAAMAEGEGEHLRAFCGFCESAGCADELQRRDWAGFARIYNGPGFRANRYDEKLAIAYTDEVGPGAAPLPPAAAAPFSLRIGMRGDAVRALQDRLAALGYQLLADGIFGRVTQIMVERFQAARGLVVDGLVGPATRSALGMT